MLLFLRVGAPLQQAASRRGAQALGVVGFSSCGVQA